MANKKATAWKEKKKQHTITLIYLKNKKKILSCEASSSTASYCLNKQSTDPFHASVLKAGGRDPTHNTGKQHV